MSHDEILLVNFEPVGVDVKRKDRTGACPVKFMSMRSEANFTGVAPKDSTGAISVVNRKFSYLKKLINLRTSLACFKLRKHVKKNTRMF